MEQRVNIENALPQMWKAMYGLSVAVSQSSLTAIEKHLIMVRTSQINSCAFCLNMHTKEALKLGETQQRLFIVGAWRETDLFSDREKSILALTEEVTLIHQHGVSDAVYQQAEKFFSPEEIGQIIMSAVAINGWNRIAVSTHARIAD